MVYRLGVSDLHVYKTNEISICLWDFSKVANPQSPTILLVAGLSGPAVRVRLASIIHETDIIPRDVITNQAFVLARNGTMWG